MNKCLLRKIIAALILACNVALAQTVDPLWPVRNRDFVQGFETRVSGETLDFLPGLSNGQVALLARASRGSVVEFQSAVMPVDAAPFVSLVWSAAISKATQAVPGRFILYINGSRAFDFATHTDSLRTNWSLKNANTELAFVTTEITKQTHDAFGYMFLNIPAGAIKKGERITIRVEGADENSQDWYMPFGVPVTNSIDVLAEPALVRTTGGLKQRVRVEVKHAGAPATAAFNLDKKLVLTAALKPGKHVYYLLHEPVETRTSTDLAVSITGRPAFVQRIELNPVRRFEVYFLPHSHIDIGFTHKQDDVEKLQWQNLELAIKLAEQTKDYPERARFKWNAEITWAVDGYLKTAGDEKKRRFLEAVKNGWIGLDALYASQLTGLQREEEMINNQRCAIEFKDKYGIDITTAMISDVPGYSWGMVESMSQSGVKYFSSGPNHMPHLPHGGYQVGHTLETWGDVPFYWSSASGKQRVLFWMTSHGYSWFHSWSVDVLSKSGGDPVVKFLDELDKQRYPYDLVQLRYTIGNDNGPPDETMPDFIKNWNETYEWPKLRIATTLEMMTDFEKRYGNVIPTYKGDFTPYWEDGAASSALETGINRKTADRLVQAETLAVMLGAPAEYNRRIDDAWRNVLLFSEHTWGANISKSQPDSEFTKDLWRVKQSFALDAQRESERLISDELKSISAPGAEVDAFLVLNTNSWPRTSLVTLPAEWKTAGRQVTDQNGKPIETQVLKDGSVVFVAEDVPAHGAAKYLLKKTSRKSKAPLLQISGNSLSDGHVRVEWDAISGDITAITAGQGTNFVDVRDTLGFNAYWYGGLMKSNLRKQGASSVEVVEHGSVLARVRISSQAPGAKGLVREIQLVKGLGEILLTNLVDKERVLEDENLRFSFPFNVPDGSVRIEVPWATVRPEMDQLKGANKNFFSVQRWVDISNASSGITLAPVEAPLLEIGDMHGQHWMSDMSVRPWIKKYEPSNRLFSWVMNNAWFVNYKAHQEGLIPFRYALRPHLEFSDAAARKFGISQTQPLLVAPVKKDFVQPAPLLSLSGDSDVIITSMKPDKSGTAVMVRLFNASEKSSTTVLGWKKLRPVKMVDSNAREEKGAPVDNNLTLGPWEVRTIRVELQ